MQSLLMFFPLPNLARLGDLLSLPASATRLTFVDAVEAVQRRIIEQMGGSFGKGATEAIWPWAAALEQSSGSWSIVKEAFTSWLEDGAENDNHEGADQVRGVGHSVQQFLGAARPANNPGARDLRRLAELALLAPGNVLYRAVERVFSKRDTQAEEVARLCAVTSTSVHGFRMYLDTPDFHVLLHTREHRQHPAAIRRAVWDGNLEAVLDEHLATLCGLGNPILNPETEQKVLASLAQALTVGAASVAVRETGSVNARPPFRMRCHAALPFGLAGQEKESGTGELRSDSLRISFNSPFRPHVLATTSIGQEGLDFHVWSDQVVHWDLPSNPVDLEQRDGRIDRYAGLAVRRALAAAASPPPGTRSPWRTFAEAQQEKCGGSCPRWVCDGASIRRIILVSPFSRVSDDLRLLRDALSLYRLTLGQADQEALIHALHRRVTEAGEDEAKVWDWLEEARIDLSPSTRCRKNDGT